MEREIKKEGEEIISRGRRRAKLKLTHTRVLKRVGEHISTYKGRNIYIYREICRTFERAQRRTRYLFWCAFFAARIPTVCEEKKGEGGEQRERER